MYRGHGPRRSVLYMPGSNARALEKARSLPADALILDLEDAVAPDAKRDARAQVVERGQGRRLSARREVVIRVNGLNTPWGYADLVAAADRRRRCDPAAQDRELGECAPGGDRAGGQRRAGRSLDLVHDGDAARDSERRGDRRRQSARRLLRHGHLGPDQGPARAPHARPAADDHRHSGSACWRRAPSGSPSSTACISTSRTMRVSSGLPRRGASSASTARR